MTRAKYITAAVFVPFFAYLILGAPAAALNVFVGVALSLGLLEFLSLLGLKRDWSLPFGSRALALLCGIIVLWVQGTGSAAAAGAAAAISLAAIAIFEVATFETLEQAPVRIALGFLAVFYVCFLGGHFILLRNFGTDDVGAGLVAFVFVVVWLGDTGALHAGKAFGKRKLAPLVSPAKSVEGLIGGLLTNIVSALIGSRFLVDGMPAVHAMALGLAVGVVAHGGDLVESLFKRAVGTKDSGTWIPGHGGLLDRIDSLAFSAPVVYYYALFFLPGTPGS
ncbi:MAG: phosphatidate cytidylyltransferase [Candidatus Schekmanbacteria bacterium]|nr:phosphatidate cytidylyltransferase [Candidatus Schekmanbacteria bacterium]